jgi:hypothetical protein
VIAASLLGGLGNQLFQYAAGRSLALRLQTELVLNLWDLGRHDSSPAHETYALAPFQVRADLRRRVISRRPLQADDSVRGRVRNTLARFRVLEEDPARLCPEFFSAPDWTLLVGFWQSPAYFAEHESLIREELTFREPPAGRTAELLEQIASTNSVSVHVRRGDYVTDPDVNLRMGVLDERYYRRAIDAIAERSTDLQLFVFSDDLGWCRRQLDARWPVTFVEGAPADDLRLMSACRHNVIANSSFSWWGAWLDPRPDKLVVAPRQWFRDAPLRDDSIIPDDWSWIRLDSR